MSRHLFLTMLLSFGGVSCSSEPSPDAGTGGSAGTGAPTATGGSGPGAGGTLGAAGSVATGGAVAMGGTAATGGGLATGGGTGGMVGGAGPAVVDAVLMAVDMGIGTNIGNTLENTTTWETGWGQPLITQTFINGLADRGIKTVRVPVAWDTYANAGVIDPMKMNRVKEVVSWIESAGMYSIVNIHWDGGWIFNEGTADAYRLTPGVKSKFASYWQQISAAFADVGHRLVFEGVNEEGRYFIDGNSNGEPDYAALNELNQLFVTTVRATTSFNQTRALLFTGFNTDITRTCVEAFSVPNDPAGPGKLFLSLHYYTPYTFCGLDTVETWGSPATTWGTAEEKAELTRLFDLAASCSASKQVPIILGEFGVTRGVNYVREPASRTLWMKSVIEASRARKIVPVLWDTGSEISRADGSFSPEFQESVGN